MSEQCRIKMDDATVRLVIDSWERAGREWANSEAEPTHGLRVSQARAVIAALTEVSA